MARVGGGAPYGKRAILKGHGYRWSDSNDGRPKSWYADVADNALECERRYLRDEIYSRAVEIDARRVTAIDRCSGRSLRAQHGDHDMTKDANDHTEYVPAPTAAAGAKRSLTGNWDIVVRIANNV